MAADGKFWVSAKLSIDMAFLETDFWPEYWYNELISGVFVWNPVLYVNTAGRDKILHG